MLPVSKMLSLLVIEMCDRLGGCGKMSSWIPFLILGAWASRCIPKGKRFVPFVGERKKRSQVTSQVYLWEVGNRKYLHSLQFDPIIKDNYTWECDFSPGTCSSHRSCSSSAKDQGAYSVPAALMRHLDVICPRAPEWEEHCSLLKHL